MSNSYRQFSLRALFCAIALSATALALVLWSRDPGRYMARATEWELKVLAKVFTLPIICALFGGAIGVLVKRPWMGALVGLAIAGVLAPVLFVWWVQS